MRFDQTHVVIRERGLIELIELAMLVVRRYLKNLLPLWAIVVLPLATINAIVTAPLLIDVSVPQNFPGRYLWNLTLLIYLQWPWVSWMSTLFLGEAVFGSPPTTRTVIRNLKRHLGRLLYVEGFRRLTLPALGVVALGTVIPGDKVDLLVFVGFFQVLAVGFVALIRMLRPFTLDVLLLEHNPLSAEDPHVLTLNRRAASLHGGSGDLLLGRWLLEAMLLTGLMWTVFATAHWTEATIVNDWWPDLLFYTVLWPMTLWLVGVFAGIVRFLSYIDLRIRQEGWEVELALRTEAIRLGTIRQGGRLR